MICIFAHNQYQKIMTNTNQVEEAIQYGYEFTPSAYFSKGFDYFRERIGEFIGFTIVYVIISLLTGSIPFIGTIISFIISGPLSLGVVIFTHHLHTGHYPEFSTFFDGFKKFTPLFATYILQMIVYFILAIPMIFLIGIELITAFASGDMEAVMESGDVLVANSGIVFVYSLLFIYIALSFRWSLHLAYFHDYSPVNAIKTSFLLINKKFAGHLLFVVLCALAAFLGVLALLVGLFVAIPLISIADYLGYAQVTGLDNTGTENMEEDSEKYMV